MGQGMEKELSFLPVQLEGMPSRNWEWSPREVLVSTGAFDGQGTAVRSPQARCGQNEALNTAVVVCIVIYVK